MTLERRDPLPPGRYWLDVFGDDHRLIFDAWVAVHDVHVEVSEWFPGDENTLPRWFYLFSTSAETPWRMAPTLGWPTIADPSVRSSADTSTAPEAKEAVEQEVFSAASAPLLAAVGLLALLWFLTQRK